MDSYSGYLGSLGFKDNANPQIGDMKTQSPALGNDSPAQQPSNQLGSPSPAQSQLGAGFGASPPPPPAPAGSSFATADAARQTASVQQQLALARAEQQQAGEQARQGINYDAEDRGIYNSGIRGNSLAVQQGQEANKIAQLEAGAASDIGNINSDMQKQLAQEAIAKQSADQSNQMNQLQLQYLQQQIGSGSAYAQAQYQAEQDQAAMQRQIYAQQLANARAQAGLS